MTRRRDRAESGAALVTVIVVLTALLVIATPFALSMRNLEAGSVHLLDTGRARAGAELALAAARRHLEDTHPTYDLESPWKDDLDELAPDNLPDLYPELLARDPRGALRSVSIVDEQGKAHLGTASIYLLGNLLGGRATLTEDVGDDDGRLTLTSTAAWPAAGLAWCERELVEYSRTGPAALEECRRGWRTPNLPDSRAAPHPAGTDVFDQRILLLAQHGWRIRPGVFDTFRRVDGLKDIGLFGEQTYSADEVDRVRPWLGTAQGDVTWRDAQRIEGLGATRDGGVELLVADGSRYGPGTVVQLTDVEGLQEWNLVLRAVDWGDHWRLQLLEGLSGRHDDGSSRIESLARVPVNVNSAPFEVLVALLAGLGRSPVADVVTGDEAAALAVSLSSLAGGEASPEDLSRALAGPIGRGDFSTLDVVAAGLTVQREGRRRLEPEALRSMLTGALSLRSSRRLSSDKAELVARRIATARPGSHEDLARLLSTLVAVGGLDAGEREAVLRNAVDPGDAGIIGGTAPFTYSSGGVFELRAAASENRPNGRERARAFIREVVSVAPPGETVRAYQTQRDFDDLSRSGPGARGWTSRPHRLERGSPSSGPSLLELQAQVMLNPPESETDIIDLVAAFELTQGRGRVAVDRAGQLLAQGPAPSVDPEASALQPRTVRSSLPGTFHFDEGLPGLTGDTPSGFWLGDGGLTLGTSRIHPPVAGGDGRLQPFSVEFWFELDDIDAETILFDGGVDELEDRVLLYMTDRELVLRVCDTAIPDFEASMPDGRVPPSGEIRYAFDDGLPLTAGVPYHVAAWVGGSKDTMLALFVDGVPRGRRSSTTFLTADLGRTGGVGSGVASYTGSDEVMVESTAGFPRQGVLRIGRELVEYVDTRENAFLVRSAGTDDPFGGRGRRGTIIDEHPASELVELHGYVLPLGSEVAARGDGTLSSSYAEFGVAELDPTRLPTVLEATVTLLGQPQQVTFPVGTGLGPGETVIPVRAAGSTQLRNDTFQPDGGHAILFCDYGGGAVVGQDVTLPGVGNGPVPAQLDGPAWFGGAEVIRYTGFNGSALTGVQRNAAGIPVALGGPASDLLTTSSARGPDGVGGSWQDPRGYVTTFDNALTGSIPGLPDEARVLVIPISVGVTAGSLYEEYHPTPQGSLGTLPGLLQLGLDFDGGTDSTEWVRWNTATGQHLVRDDIQAVDDMLEIIETSGVWNMATGIVDDDLVDALNDELEFRGQGGTVDVAHSGGSPALPTHVIGTWGVQTFDAHGGVPGRHDAITLVDPVNGEKEWHRINHAEPDDQDWGGLYCLIGLREAVLGDFERGRVFDPDFLAVEDLPFDELLPGGDERDLVELLNVDTRRLTRILCRPSPELPSAPIHSFALGRDYGGRPSTGAATVDELRFHVADTPGPLLQKTYRYVLDDDLEHEEEQQLVLELTTLQAAHARLRSPLLGADALGAVAALPGAGGLLLVGEEIIGYAGLDPFDTGNVYITRRGMYGTPRAYHEADTPVTPLLFWPVTPLAARLDPRDAAVVLGDPSVFPDGGGLVWVGDELIGYDGVDADGLTMPSREGSHRFERDGLLRGRFGTAPQSHDTGEMVRWQPERHRDGALLGSGAPEAERYTLPVWAPGAFFTDLVVAASLPDPTVGLELRVVLDDAVSAHADPAGSPSLFAARAAGPGEERLLVPVGRGADRLDLHLFGVWEAGAFDPVEFRAGGWKLAPWVRSVVVGHVQPSAVLEHEEWP